MKSNKQLLSIINEILEQMYEEADPPIDYHRAKDYMDHKLSSKRQNEIQEAVLSRIRGLTDRDKTAIGFAVFNNSPYTAE